MFDLFATIHDDDWEVGGSLGAALYGLARLTRSQIILEFGTFRGFSALCFARAIEEDVAAGRQTRDARVITCDIEDYDKHGDIIYNDFIELRRSDSSDRTAVRKLYSDNMGKCRIIFFDTRHSVDRARREFECIVDIVDEDTLILFHDADTGDERRTVWQLFSDIGRGRYNTAEYEFHAICIPTRWSDDFCLGKKTSDNFGRKYSDGLGIIRKELIRNSI